MSEKSEKSFNFSGLNGTPALQWCVLLLIAVALYASNFDHTFHLDSVYGIKDNKAIESLANIPSFFVDPFTLTSLRTNADYRPILQVTHAINFAISGHQMWSWHLVQIALHVFNACSLMALVSFLLPRMIHQPSFRQTVWIPCVVAALFVVHPTASGVVNYIWARSSLLTAAFLLPSMLCFMKGRYRMASLLYGLAIFTKIEAVGALGVFAMWLVFLEAEKREDAHVPGGNFVADLASILHMGTLRILAPMLVLTALNATLRGLLLPDFLAVARSDPSMTALSYFSTQLTAWWTYVGHWWVPLNLVADDLAYPIYPSLQHPTVLLAILGWCLVGVVVGRLYSQKPILAFLTVSAFALISPHSSFMPLTEMVNEHRPYLPIGILSLIWIVPGTALLLGQAQARPARRFLGSMAIVVVLATLAFTTHERNRVFETWTTYWNDTVQKSPSWRSHTNMGWQHLQDGENDKAEAQFLSALRFRATNSVVLSNLGVVQDRKGKDQAARQFHDKAVANERHTSIALEGRAQHHLRLKSFTEARIDLDRALPISIAPISVHHRLAQAHAGLGDWEMSLAHTLAARTIDETATEQQIIEIAAPFWYSKEQSRLGIAYFSALEQKWPGRWWVHANLARLATEIGETKLATLHAEKAKQLQLTP
jgi:tetratricopeptide (TPR) repeat protein